MSNRLLVALTAVCLTAGAAQAVAGGETTGSITGFPVPRFVSLKADKVNMHVGPGKDYDVKWVYTRPALPMEITAEFDNWRRVRDSDGAEGWIYHSLLSGRRTALVTGKSGQDLAPIRDSADIHAAVTANLQAGVVASVKKCEDTWCHIAGNGFDGWIEQNRLWGVYPNEKVD